MVFTSHSYSFPARGSTHFLWHRRESNFVSPTCKTNDLTTAQGSCDRLEKFHLNLKIWIFGNITTILVIIKVGVNFLMADFTKLCWNQCVRERSWYLCIMEVKLFQPVEVSQTPLYYRGKVISARCKRQIPWLFFAVTKKKTYFGNWYHRGVRVHSYQMEGSVMGLRSGGRDTNIVVQQELAGSDITWRNPGEAREKITALLRYSWRMFHIAYSG